MNQLIDRVLGRLTEEIGPEAALMAEPERQSRETYDEESGQSPETDELPSQTVLTQLLDAWHGGQRAEVASQILFSPVSYADFARFVYAIGQEDAIQLGLMLDDMAESEGVAPDASHERVLSNVQRQAQAPSPAPAPAEVLPEPETEPHDVGTQLEP